MELVYFQQKVSILRGASFTVCRFAVRHPESSYVNWWLRDCCSVAQLCLILYCTMDCRNQASLSLTIAQSLLKLMSVELVIPSNHLILCCPLLLPSLFPNIRVFSKELALHIKWPKYWSFSFSIRLSNEYSGLISFRIDWIDLLAVQGTLKSLLQ